MRRLIRWSLVIAAVIAGAYFLTAGAETRSTRASIPPPVVQIPLASNAPSFAAAASHGVEELIHGDRSVGWNPYTGLWGGHARPNWWQSALIMQSLVRYLERTDNVDPIYQHVLDRIYQHNVYKPFSRARYNFANEFMDDTAWWGLAWLEASRYELKYRHDQARAATYLGVAEYDANYILRAPRQCGGIVWALRRTPDSVTSAEFISLAAKLSSYRQASGIFHDPTKAAGWLTDARDVLRWLEHSGMVDVNWGYVIDRIQIGGGCHDFVGGPLTYTEGEMADALVQMGVATHDPVYFKQAEHFIRYVLNYKSGLIAHGVLQEHCESLNGRCRHNRNRLDITAFKGIFVQAVDDWTQATGHDWFHRFLHNQAASVVDNAIVARDNQPANCAAPDTCRFAFAWGHELDPGPPSVPVTPASQESAIDALTAVLPAKIAGED